MRRSFKTRAQTKSKNVCALTSLRVNFAAPLLSSAEEFTADQSKRPARLHAPAGPIRPVSKEGHIRTARPLSAAPDAAPPPPATQL